MNTCMEVTFVQLSNLEYVEQKTVKKLHGKLGILEEWHVSYM